MSKMQQQIRRLQSKDAEQLLSIYQQFVLNFVGSAARSLKTFQSIARKRDNLRYVALNKQGKIVGYILATYVKGRRTGRISEIVVAPDHDFETVAKPLVDKVYNVLLEKGATTVYADTIRNPYYPELFDKFGFFDVETDGVFMFAVTDVARFLEEIAPIITARLKQSHDWNGLLQMTCEENSRFFRKHQQNVQPLLATNYQADCKISLNASTLANILLGRVDAQKAWTEGVVNVETTISKDKIKKLLTALFPKKQFLALDQW
jgi:N-acetylglutamate synthase-like GNAT family acetyltransferase